MKEVRKNPNLPWNIRRLSCNHTLTVDDFQSLEFKDGNWDWDWYHISSTMSVIEIRDNLAFDLHMRGLSQNPTLTVDDIQFLSETDEEWDWHHISRVISLSEVRKNPNLPWDKYGLSNNPTLTVDDIQSLSGIDGIWHWYKMSRVISLSEVRKNPDLPWDKRGLSQNPTLTVDDIQSLSGIDGEWDWYHISRVISMDEVCKNPNLPWRTTELCWNPTLTVDNIRSLLDIYCDIERSLENSTLNIDDAQPPDIDSLLVEELNCFEMFADEVGENPDLSCSKTVLPENPTLSAYDIHSSPYQFVIWNWVRISSMIPITYVYMYPNMGWSRTGLSMNKNIRVSDLIAWHEIPPSIYKKWQYPTDVIIV